MTHWHIDKATHHPTLVGGDVGDCCDGFATWGEVFGPRLHTVEDELAAEDAARAAARRAE